MNLFVNSNPRKELEERMRQAGRLPPGQATTLKWPVLHYGGIPRFDPQTWDFRVFGLVEEPLRFSYDKFLALPRPRNYLSVYSKEYTFRPPLTPLFSIATRGA